MVCAITLSCALGACAGESAVRSASADPTRVRIATYNIKDVRTEEVMDAGNNRLRRIARVIQTIQSDILLINEITYDQPTDDGATRTSGARKVRGSHRSAIARSWRRRTRASTAGLISTTMALSMQRPARARSVATVSALDNPPDTTRWRFLSATILRF